VAVLVLFSVIVPTYGRPQALASCLQALKAQTLDRERYEILVVDDALPVAPPVEEGVSYLRLDRNSGPSAARNCGARHAQRRFLAFIDDDFPFE